MATVNPIEQYANALTRRHFFGQGAFGLGAAALASMLPSSILAPPTAFGNSVAAGGMPDHVHLLVSCDPQFGIHRLVKQIKGRSSRVLRAEFPALKSRLPTLWTNSYFVATVGGATTLSNGPE